MENVISINNNNKLPIKEYNGQRVVTLKEIDAVHGRTEGTARRNFNRNKNRFIEGVDYFVRNSDEAKKEFGVTAPNGLILMTESGYLMLVKSFTDALAWTVQRELVNNYFRVKELIKEVPPKPQRPLFDDALIALNVLRWLRYSNTETAHDFEKTPGCSSVAVYANGRAKICEEAIREVALFINTNH